MIISFEINLGLSTWDEVYSAIEAKISEGFEIIDTVAYQHDGEPIQRFTLRKPDAVATVDANQLQVRSIVSFERTSTFSKSAKRHFDFWRCVLDSGDKVNIFDHPDDERNTFKIAIKQGWKDIFADTDEDIEYEPKVPIPVTVMFDGDWFALVDVQSIGRYMLASRIMDVSEILNDEGESADSDESD